MAGGQQQTDPMITWAVVIGMLVAGIYGLWIVTYATTGPLIIGLKRAELYPLTFISREAALDYQRLNRVQAETALFAANGNLAHEQMWDAVMLAGTWSGQHYRAAFGFILLGVMGYVMFLRPNQQFKTTFNLEGMIAAHARRWPVITPFIKFNPSKNKTRSIGARVPVNLPPFAEALYPEEWMAHNRIRVVNGVPDRDQIRRAFLPQLGARFDGVDALPEHLYCVLAAFALKGARKRSECDALLGEIARCWSPERGFLVSAAVKSQSARVLGDSKYAEPLLAVMNKHAYETTAFIAALKWARRQGGVLAPAQFVWMRGQDRTMWYPLNNLDRRAFHVEAAGAMAHYMAEVQAGRPLSVPRLEAAVVSVAQYLSETRARIPEIEGGSATEKKDARLPGGGATLQLGTQGSSSGNRRN